MCEACGAEGQSSALSELGVPAGSSTPTPQLLTAASEGRLCGRAAGGSQPSKQWAGEHLVAKVTTTCGWDVTMEMGHLGGKGGSH